MYTPLSGGAYVIAEEILRRLAKVAADLGVILPERQVICAGGAAVECEQVAVMLGGWAPLGQELSVPCQRLWAAQMSVVIIRKALAMPTASGRKAPGPAAINDGGALASNDADVLLELANTLDVVGEGLLITIGMPEGGYQSVELVAAVGRVGGL